MEAVIEANAGDSAFLSASEKREMIDTLAEMIASTIEGASVTDVHEALASHNITPGGWRELVQRKVEARRQRKGSDVVSAIDIAPVTQDTPLPPTQTPTTRTWECPNCGTQQEVVDARRSLRHSGTSLAVRILSDTFPVGCGVCEGVISHVR
ncbi:hypothetical protein C3747_80g28 [Trypanosoma cruzi]|uniref:Uncharacterized protein n=2 Tax=Trypanosoma cruzi TaxID=5693 RepID=Q4D2E3_TRYCC|nr:hypothetical protein, conserved [Trypanosoma cruzi]EAN86691.1 hypothetical protein, conserved [Trypanosoma cruzi]PWV09302.1 hypothetical protein C3747_80g28 [Trypanosoma cruzi]RNC55903.1 hypothetical protein TcCL_ESM06564 [Trypanosoma cruzi]|eukprot:XP_808542.1 hypothetical protein [Trypanosoma cruzi strain CL Brener]